MPKTFDHRQFTGWNARSFTVIVLRRLIAHLAQMNRILSRCESVQCEKKEEKFGRSRDAGNMPNSSPREINENWRATWSVAFNAYQRDDIAIPRKEHGKTYVLSGDRVTSVLTNWGQLFVRRWRCIGKPYRSIQSICTAVHDELELHSTTLNLEALVSEGFTFQATLLPLLRKNQLFWS